MKTTIDGAGRIVVPKAIREALGLQGGTPVEISLEDGRIAIVPAHPAGRLRREGGLLVYEPPPGGEGLTLEAVEAVRAAIRDGGR